MSRIHLLGAASAVALACSGVGAQAKTTSTIPLTVTGGGSTLAKYDYVVEFDLFNGNSPKAMFSNVNPDGGTTVYWASGSGAGQKAFLNDDITCDSSAVLTGTSTCSGDTGGANSVDYGASDATLSSTQISSWSSLPDGQAVSGNLIQLPSMGVGVSFPIVNSAITANGQAVLDDKDLCNIFTGGFTNWNQTSHASSLTPGTITVVFRGDGSGTSFLLLNHLTNVCTAANGNAPPAGVTLAASTTFASIFPTSSSGIFTKAFTPSGSTTTYYTPANFQPETGSGGIANYLSGQSGTAPTSATAYLTPDFTTIDPKSNATLMDGTMSKLVVAGVVNADNGVTYTPTLANIETGLNNAASGQNLTPPTGSNLSNPSAYVPLIQTTNSGYSVVGYTTFDFAQCYYVKNVGSSIKTFLNDHYDIAGYKTDQENNGFVPLSLTKASGFLTVIKNNILSNKTGNNLEIDDTTACKGIGR